MCTKQTSVSHSSTEGEIVSLDAGLCMDGIPPLTLGDLAVEVFQSVSSRWTQERAMEKLVIAPSH